MTSGTGDHLAASASCPIHLEEAQVLAQEALPGQQHVLRLRAPKIAACARPGSFAHLRCHPLLPMRRPLSLMRVERALGWVEFLYRVVGEGTRWLAARRPGETLSVLGPIGQPFTLHAQRRRPLLVGGGVGIPPLVFLAELLRNLHADYRPLALFGSERPFPFAASPSRIPVPGIPADCTAAMPLLEDWGIPNRLASRNRVSGRFEGFVTDLARVWLAGLAPEARGEVEIFACGPQPMLEACARLTRDLDLPCQVSLEAAMACAVGGCAGCAVEVHLPNGRSMQRVCVDGPVFDARLVFPSPPRV